MNNATNYEKILAGLRATKKNFQTNIKHLQSELEKYEQNIDQMESVGMYAYSAKQQKAYEGLKVRIDGLREYLEIIIVKIAKIEKYIQQSKSDGQHYQEPIG